MPTPLTISFCRLALLPTEASLADGAEPVLLQLQWIDSPCTNLSTMRVPALRPRFQVDVVAVAAVAVAIVLGFRGRWG